MDDNPETAPCGPLVPSSWEVVEFDSPIAFRTRGIESYHDAAHCGFCRVCGGRFEGMTELWNHLHDDHPASERRLKAVEAFPMGFQLERMPEVLPSEEWRSNASSPPGIPPSPDARASKASRNAGRVEGRLSTLSPDAMSPTGPHSQGEATMHGSPIRSIFSTRVGHNQEYNGCK
ncbi:hypothetical protein TNCV_1327921 [Trichonephila clavipes]|nr:hypothetical protein TNCV_1327921 [Trichonephila clavipes]